MKHILISRRLSFLHHILNSSKTGLLLRFYNIQKDCPVRNDWVLQIEKDRNEIDLNLSDAELSSVTKYQFKKILKRKVNAAAIKELNFLAIDHSKSKPL